MGIFHVFNFFYITLYTDIVFAVYSVFSSNIDELLWSLFLCVGLIYNRCYSVWCS